MLQSCGSSCKFKCNSRVSEDQRRQIFEMFWALGNKERQWNFVSNSINIQPTMKSLESSASEDSDSPTFLLESINTQSHSSSAPKLKDLQTTTKKKVKNNSIKYFFKIDSSNIVVCKKMFLNSLSISNSAVKTIIKKFERGVESS